MTHLIKPLPDCTIFLLAKAYQKAHGRFKEMLKPYGLTNLQHLVLEGLWYESGQTAAELGKMLGVLDRMSEAGWIEKQPDAVDRRVVRLFPTRRADDQKAQLIELRQRANGELLERFSVEEQMLLKRFLWDLMDMPR